MALISKLLVGLGIDAREFDEGLDKSEKKAGVSAASIGNKLASVGAKMALAGGALAVTAVAGAVAGGITTFQNWANTLDSMGDVLGTNAQDSAALAVAIQGVGGNVEGITSQMTILTRGLMNAKGEIGPTGTVLQSLGIAFQDAQGNILPTTDILTAVADKIASMPDGLQKTSLMTDLFGKSGKDLGDTLGALANGGMAAAAQKASELGLTLSDQTVGASIEAGKQLETLKLAGQGLFVTIGSQLLPILMPFLTQLIAWGMEIMPQVRQGIVDVAGWIQTALIPGIQNILTWLQPVFAFLQDNWQPILITVGTIIGVFLVAAFISWAVAAATAAAGTIAALAPVLVPVLAIAAVMGLLALAWKNNWGGIQEKTKAVLEWMKPFIDNAMTAIRKVFELFSLAFSGDWEGFGKKLREIWDMAIENIKLAWKRFTEIDWGEVGKNIVMGIANGITSAVDWVINAVQGLGGAAVAAIKGFLGISSESTVMKFEVGRNMALGVVEGFDEGMRGINANISMPSISRVTAVRPVTVMVDYHPMLSTADEFEVRQTLGPVILEVVRSV